ncbi:hypothetical protein GEMRC1_008122 [Eukaryota sp. GEM-RC1]
MRRLPSCVKILRHYVLDLAGNKKSKLLLISDPEDAFPGIFIFNLDKDSVVNFHDGSKCKFIPFSMIRIISVGTIQKKSGTVLSLELANDKTITFFPPKRLSNSPDQERHCSGLITEFGLLICIVNTYFGDEIAIEFGKILQVPNRHHEYFFKIEFFTCRILFYLSINL